MACQGSGQHEWRQDQGVRQAQADRAGPCEPLKKPSTPLGRNRPQLQPECPPTMDAKLAWDCVQGGTTHEGVPTLTDARGNHQGGMPA